MIQIFTAEINADVKKMFNASVLSHLQRSGGTRLKPQVKKMFTVSKLSHLIIDNLWHWEEILELAKTVRRRILNAYWTSKYAVYAIICLKEWLGGWHCVTCS